MSQIKTTVSDANVEDFIATVENEQKRKDSLDLLAMFKKITGEEPKMWGTSIIGFGMYHYKSERSSQEGDWPLTGFSPRKQSLTLYVMPGFGNMDKLLAQLGKHKVSKSCLYINKLADVDTAVLEKIIARGYEIERSYQQAKKQSGY